MSANWVLIPAVILTFLFIITPVILWLVDRAFRKPLGQRLFAVSWNKWGMSAALLCWMIWFWFKT
jgi:hypothetical protein